MTATATPEFSRRVPLARLGPAPFRQDIAASEDERRALARRFGLVALDRLCAAVELVHQGRDMVLLRAAFEAEFVQSCVITLDPVAGAVSQHFALLYGPPDKEEVASGIVGDEVAFQPLDGPAIDIGEAVAQEFSLALPPFPRRSDARIDTDEPAPDGGPFAALSRLVTRRGGM